MSTPVVTPDQLGLILNTPILSDDPRGIYVLQLAQELCESVVTPLPAGAAAVILDVAARAWVNPQAVTSETVGPYSAQYGKVSGGLWLTQQNKATLRRLAGGGGAFTIDMTPTGAMTNVPAWDRDGWWGGDSTSWDMNPGA